MDDIELYNILYPRRFDKLEDVQFYLSGDVLTCLICGKSYQILSRHLTSGHRCSHKKYKDLLNIPRKYPLMTKSIIEQRSLHGKEQMEKSPEKLEMLKCGAYNKTGYNGGIVSSISIKNKKEASERNGKANKGHKHHREIGECSSCGKQIEISSLRRNRIVKCEDCRSVAQMESAKLWNEKNKDNLKEYRRLYYLKNKVSGGV